MNPNKLYASLKLIVHMKDNIESTQIPNKPVPFFLMPAAKK